MKPILSCFVAVVSLSISLLLSACIPLTPQDIACDSIIDVDLIKAYNNPAYEGRNVFWTVHFNFKEPTVGCFRLYARDMGTGAFVPIDNGGHLIKRCQISGDVQFQNTSLPHSSHSVGPLVNSGTAIFDGDSHIECHFSVQELTKNTIASALEQIPNIHSLSDLLAHFDVIGNTDLIMGEIKMLQSKSHHNLNTFTLIAAGAISQTNIQSSSPVLFYLPLEDDSCCTPISMDVLGVDSLHTTGIRSYMQNALFSTDDCPDISRPENYNYYWWVDFLNDGSGGDALPRFSFRQMGGDIEDCNTEEGMESAWQEIGVQDFTGTPTVSSIDEISVWTGLTKLYIGCRPDASFQCESYFEGDLYGVMIDPVNSKPQIGD